MGYIYKITNGVNGKMYIGQTSTSIAQRWYEHKYTAHYFNSNRCQDHLYCAMRKYGIDNFAIETVEEVDDSRLDEREQYWIAFYDTCNSGYNMTLGGSGGHTIDHDLINTLWNQGFCVKEISEKVPCADSTAVAVLKSNPSYSTEESRARGFEFAARSIAHSVSQYDLDGKFIRTYPSIQDAADACGLITSNISSVCRGISLSVGRYQWRYKQDPPPGQLKQKVRKVSQFDLSGVLVAEYDSCADAGRALEILPQSVWAVCMRHRHTCADFIWRFSDDADDVKPRKKYFLKRNVVQMDLEGNYINQFPSAAEASRQTGVCTGSIYQCCSGAYKTAGGFTWKYAV